MLLTMLRSQLQSWHPAAIPLEGFSSAQLKTDPSVPGSKPAWARTIQRIQRKEMRWPQASARYFFCCVPGAISSLMTLMLYAMI